MKLEIIKLDNISWKKKTDENRNDTEALRDWPCAAYSDYFCVNVPPTFAFVGVFFIFHHLRRDRENDSRAGWNRIRLVVIYFCRKKIGRRGLRPTCRTRLVGSTNETSGVQLGRRRSTALIGPCQPWFIASNLEDVPRVGRPSVTLIGPSRQLAHVLHHGCSAGSPIGPRVGSIINHDFVGFYWICLGLIRFDWVWASLTGLWLGSVGFYWVFISFTEF